MVKGHKGVKLSFVSTMAGSAWGGSEELWSQTALRLLKSGHQVNVSTYQWPELHPRLAELNDVGAQVSLRALVPTLAERLKDKVINRFFHHPLDAASMAWLQRQGADHVIISQGFIWDGLPWMQACHQLNIPYSPIVHANSEIWWPEDDQLQTIRRAYAGATRIFFVSQQNQEMLEVQCGERFYHGEVVVNPWNVDATRVVEWPEDPKILSIACIGRLDPRAKGQDLLIKLLSEPKWKRRPIQLNFYGDGPCKESLEVMARMFEMSNITFRGQVSDVRNIWAENHALILPSRFEGLPLVIIEAMFCGRMVITTNVAGNATYLTNNVDGFIASAPVVEALDEAMERAWIKRKEWREMGARARVHVLALLPADPIELFSKKVISLAAPANVCRTLRKALI